MIISESRSYIHNYRTDIGLGWQSVTSAYCDNKCDNFHNKSNLHKLNIGILTATEIRQQSDWMSA